MLVTDANSGFSGELIDLSFKKNILERFLYFLQALWLLGNPTWEINNLTEGNLAWLCFLKKVLKGFSIFFAGFQMFSETISGYLYSSIAWIFEKRIGKCLLNLALGWLMSSMSDTHALLY